MINICVYEDTHYKQLYPLTFNRPAYDLLVGTNLILNKIEQFFDYANISLHCRPELKPSLKEKFTSYPINTINSGTPCLFINGRTILTQPLYNQLAQLDDLHNHLLLHKGHVIGAYFRGDLLDQMITLLNNGPVSNTTLFETFRKNTITKQLKSCLFIQYPWDLIELNNELITTDFMYKNKPGINKGDTRPYVAIYNEDNIFIDINTLIEDYVVLDASKGPIYIENNVHIHAHTRIEGPIFIGKHSTILGGSIKQSSIGPHCKVSGEITQSIIYGYSNKTHSGFIGNSYIGEWVNLGAFTTTSNLKNNYNTIPFTVQNKQVDTKLNLLGSFIGDYVKTSIHTSLNTGAHIGFGSTLFNTGFHNSYIPPFSWGSPNTYTPHDINKLIQTTKIMMSRRNHSLSKTKQQLLQWLFQNHTS
jgi:UDP-N-acetylglucosamine diphosphorylase/glucosamine-1-phosphate N-acetyltransferase